MQEDTRQLIVKTATTMFTQQGCKRITMDDIAKELHISKRTLYEYFDNKEELLVACFQTMSDHMKQAQQELAEKGTSPIVMLLYMFRKMASRNYDLSLMISDTQHYYPAIHQRFFHFSSEECATTFREILVQAQAEGKLRQQVDIDLVERIMQYFFSKMANTQREDQEMVCESGFTFVRGLLSAETIAQFDAEEEKIKILTQ